MDRVILNGVFISALAIVLATAISVANASQCDAGFIIEPRWAAPYAVKPGSYFTVTLRTPVTNVEEAYLSNGTVVYELQLEPLGEQTFKAFIPSTVTPGLYDLVIVVNGRICGEHNAVWVLDDYPQTLILMHVSDTHFGVFNPTGKSAKEYNLAAVVLALSLPNVTAVIATGDIADKAAVEQYMDLRLVYGLLDKPVFIVPGNHDHIGGTDNFETYVAPLQWMRIIGDFLLIALNSGYKGFISIEQAKWAAMTIMNNTDKVKLILIHHPLFAYVYDDIPHSFTVDDSDELLELLKTKKPRSRYPYVYTSWLENEKALKILVDAIYYGNVTAILSGHIHVDSYAEVRRPNGPTTHFIVATTLGGPIRLERNDYHGFRLVIVGSDGSVNVLGQNVPWARHSSYNIEGVDAVLKVGPGVSSIMFRINDPDTAKLLPKLRLAVPVPKELREMEYKIYAPGFRKVWERCTDLYCAVYAITERVEVGKWYVLAVYTIEDLKPPSIVEVNIPSKVTANKPIVISYSVSDDAWGIGRTVVELEIDGRKMVIYPVRFDNEYRLSLPPLGKTGIIKAKIIVYDASGKATIVERTIEVVKSMTLIPSPTQALQPQPITTKPTMTPVHTRTITSVITTTKIESIEITVTRIPEEQEIKEITLSQPTVLDQSIAIIASVVMLVLAAIAYMIIYRGERRA